MTAVVRRAGDAVESAETAAVTVHLEYSHDRWAGRPGGQPAHPADRVGRLDAVGELVVALGRLDDVEVTGPSWGLRPDSPAVRAGPAGRGLATPSDRARSVRRGVRRGADRPAGGAGPGLRAAVASESRGPWRLWHRSRQATWPST